VLARWSLRRRLLAALVLLVALVYALLAITSTLALRHFLVGRLDDQLVAAGSRSAYFGGPRPDGDHGSPEGSRKDIDTGAQFVLAPGQPAGTLGARVVGGSVTDAGLLSQSGTLQPLATQAAADLSGLPVNAPTTVRINGLGEFRALANRASDGDVLVTALPMREIDAAGHQLLAVQALLAVVALLLAALAAAGIVRRTLRPLDRVARLATHVSALPLERGEVELAERVPAGDTDPRTEVGQVGAALNRLLDAVGGALSARHASEQRVRQFVADASHELRTPLASIRGYAELTRRSGTPVPDDVAHALRRVESEAQRMTLLVEDLLLLARLDSGRPLAHDLVDLTSLVIDGVSDASAAGPDHRWRLELPDEPVEVCGDGARLHQVLANLLANARTHTPAGSSVTASLEAMPEQVRLAVTDDGPGLPPALAPHVFERFARGDGSRTRSSGAASTGLGLAIVEAIIASHGGSVEVSSRPGRTVFSVLLPATERALAEAGPGAIHRAPTA